MYRSRGAILAGVADEIEVVDDLDVEEPRTGEALVRIAVAGICGSDLAVLGNKFNLPRPLVFGHEAAGEIVALGPETDGAVVGSTVALWMRPPCRRCSSCRRGDAALCEATGVMSARGTLPDGSTRVSRHGEVVHRAYGVGAFAEYVVMPVSGLVELPEGTRPEVAALLSCGVATGAGAILNVAQPSVGDTVVVFGGGGVGTAAALTALAVGAGRAVVVDPSPQRREAALSLGVTSVLAPDEPRRLREALRELGISNVDVAVDAVGAPGIVETAYRLVRQGGAVVCVGLSEADAVVSLPAMQLATSHKRVLGCYMGGIDPHRDLPRILTLHERGVLPIDRMVTQHCSLDGIPGAVRDMAAGQGLRTVIRIDGG